MGRSLLDASSESPVMHEAIPRAIDGLLRTPDARVRKRRTSAVRWLPEDRCPYASVGGVKGPLSTAEMRRAWRATPWEPIILGRRISLPFRRATACAVDAPLGYR